jgi:hypothetical protein
MRRQGWRQLPWLLKKTVWSAVFVGMCTGSLALGSLDFLCMVGTAGVEMQPRDLGEQLPGPGLDRGNPVGRPRMGPLVQLDLADSTRQSLGVSEF